MAHLFIVDCQYKKKLPEGSQYVGLPCTSSSDLSENVVFNSFLLKPLKRTFRPLVQDEITAVSKIASAHSPFLFSFQPHALAKWRLSPLYAHPGHWPCRTASKH